MKAIIKVRASARFLVGLFCAALLVSLFPSVGFTADLPDLSGYRICIDPGHQARLDNRQEPAAPGRTDTKDRISGGARGVVTKTKESELNLEVALKLRDALTSCGAEVLLTRESEDVRLSNVQRAQMANQFRADVFLRLHCDNSSDPGRRGIGVYAPLRSAKAYYGKSQDEMKAWVISFGETLKAATGAPHNRYAVQNGYSGSNWAQMPTFLIEMGYMSNEADDALLLTEAYQQGLIQGMAEFIATLPKDVYRDHPVMASPVMENRESQTETLRVREEPSSEARTLGYVTAGNPVFVMDDLGNGWFQVQTYERGVVGYTDCATLGEEE